MYQWFLPISNIFNIVLGWIHTFIHSYGWSIVVLTVLFRGAMLPLDIKSKISMKKQALLQPKIAKINEKYKNDKEKAAAKTMELYKQEKTSPLSGCLPSLIQMPLFFAFFGALQIIAGQEIHTLYNAVISSGIDSAQKLIEPWLWVHNVWAPDTAFFGASGFNFMGLNSAVVPGYHAVVSLAAFKGITQAQYEAVMNGLIARTSSTFNGWFILPLLAGLTSWLQTKLTMPPQQAQANPNQPKNPLSGKTMQYIFPLISVFFTASSNSVFALYWITSNLVSIATYKGVDMVWKVRANKEQEEKEKLEEADKAVAAIKVTETKAIEAPKNTDKSSSGNKTYPKEGKKK
jgi:YidC/Oxa1 family membrane protein insertase